MSLEKPKILVIEDEPSQVELLRHNLKRQGFDVVIEMDGQDGVNAAQEELPDLILLDWMLPGLSGVEACRQLRHDSATREIPIIMLTARSEERDKVRGLDVGADDYVTKPYSIKELMARIRAALRRPAASVLDNKLTIGALEIDLEKHRVFRSGISISLSATEFRLLVTLAKSPDRVFSRDQLLDIVWGLSADVNTRTVDVHIGRLRRALDIGNDTEIVRTVRGFGYSFRP